MLDRPLDYISSFVVPDSYAESLIDIVGVERQRRLRHLGEKLIELLEDGRRLTVKLCEEQGRSLSHGFGWPEAATEHILRLEIGVCHERNPIWMKFEQQLGVPVAWSRPSMLSRLRKFVAETWAATGTEQRIRPYPGERYGEQEG